MSEPESKLDLTALSDALGDGAAAGAASSTGAIQGKQQAKKETDSPETLSPTSPGGSPTRPPAAATAAATAVPAGAVPVRQQESTTPTLSPEAQNIKAMFPDFDGETIVAVLAAEGGHQERAINVLLSMSDPTYVAPPMTPADGQTQSDEQLARSLAMQEQQQQQQSSRQRSQRVGGGDGFSSLFGSSTAPSNAAASSPSYDANNLTYQPRVRKTGVGQGAAPATRPPLESRDSAERRYHEGQSLVTGWPGPREAKAWQEDLNKLAENGLSKAASTFSALRQRGEQAWAQSRVAQQQQQQQQGGQYQQGQQQGQYQQGQYNSRKASDVVSPTLGSSRGFDRDASPVGENELAKILARGRNDSYDEKKSSGSNNSNPPPRRSSSSSLGGAGATNSVADRYKSVLRKNSSSSQQQQSKADEAGYGGEEENLSWDDAGRTPQKTFEPIQIADNSAAKQQQQQQQRNAVHLMENSTGRGLTSPRGSVATAGAAGVAAGAGAGAALAAGKKSLDDNRSGHDNEDDDDDDEDDLEYVANPFEDED